METTIDKFGRPVWQFVDKFDGILKNLQDAQNLNLTQKSVTSKLVPFQIKRQLIISYENKTTKKFNPGKNSVQKKQRPTSHLWC